MVWPIFEKAPYRELDIPPREDAADEKIYIKKNMSPNPIRPGDGDNISHFLGRLSSNNYIS